MSVCLPLQPSGVATFPLGRSRAGGGRRPPMSINSASSANPPPTRQRRFAVLKTGHASDYTERTHGGYGRMLARLLSDGGGENWDIFPVVDGDFSFLDRGEEGSRDGDYYDGYVLTGSAADAHSTDVDWISRLCDALAILHRQRKKLLGICFGHQILARALGGTTGRAPVGWELGVKSLHVDADRVSQLYGLALPSTLNAIESHQDQVLMAPPGAVLLASSEKTKIEMFAVGNHVLGMQCHPEFSEDVMMDIIQSRLSQKIITDEVAKDAIKSFEKSQPDQDLLQTLCKIFLKGRS